MTKPKEIIATSNNGIFFKPLLYAILITKYDKGKAKIANQFPVSIEA